MIAREGYVILIPLVILLLVGVLAFVKFHHNWLHFINALLAVFLLFSLYFFRVPNREIPAGKENFISPGDGKIVKIVKIEDSELGQVTQISIFLSIFNVHKQYIPLAGKVISTNYLPGKFLAAFNDKASLENEQTSIILETDKGDKYKIKQIAGLIARRVICNLKPDQKVNRGAKLGFIRFGSRVDILVPEQFAILIKVGDRVVGGQTIIGVFK